MQNKKERDLSIKLTSAEIELLKSFGERIKRARLANKLSMASLAELSKVTEAIVRKVERGTTGVAIGRYLQVLAALGRANDISQLLNAPQYKTVVILRSEASGGAQGHPTVKVVARKKKGAPKKAVPKPKKVANPSKKKEVPTPAQPKPQKPPKPASSVKRRWTARYTPPTNRGRKKQDTPDEVS